MYGSMEAVVDHIESYDENLQLQATRHLKRVISTEGTQTIDAIIKAKYILPELVKFLYKDDNSELQFEAASVVQSMAAGSSKQIAVLMKNDCLSAFEHLLLSNHDTACQGVWALGFVAKDCQKICDFKLILTIAKMPLLATTCLHLPLLKAVAWTMSTVTEQLQAIPQPILEFLPTIMSILRCNPIENDDLTTIWRELVTGPGKHAANRTEMIVRKGIHPELAAILKSDDVSSVMLALRAFTIILDCQINWAAREDWDPVPIDFLIDKSVLSHITELLNHSRVIVQREASEHLEKLSIKSPQSLDYFISDSNAVATLLQKIANADDKVQSNIINIFRNVVLDENRDLMVKCINAGVIQTFCRLLVKSSDSCVFQAICALQDIFEVCDFHELLELLKSSLKDHGGWDEIKSCQNNSNALVAEMASDLIQEHFVQ